MSIGNVIGLIDNVSSEASTRAKVALPIYPSWHPLLVTKLMRTITPAVIAIPTDSRSIAQLVKKWVHRIKNTDDCVVARGLETRAYHAHYDRTVSSLPGIDHIAYLP
jgi:hypothetical protein